MTFQEEASAMKMSQYFRSCKFLAVVALPLSIATITCSENIAQAQIIPDETLGTEGSVVTPLNGQADRIEGGATRGSKLFHSFREFNINEGRGAYFANPAAIENIFSRVTGSNPSRLLGTLGVLGDANLFFLNPNGIIFGKNASLDIRGSLVTSTASSLLFPDGDRFSATNPQAPPLLEIDVPVPIGLQFEGEETGAIISAGELEVGGNLTLVGGTVASTGQLSAPGELISVAALPEASLVKLGESGQLLDWERSPITNDSEVEVGSLSLPELLTKAGDETGLQFTSDGQMELVESGIRFSANPGTAIVSGNIDASNTEPGQTGGKVSVLGDRVGLIDNAQINVSGDAGGGTVLIGGDFQGKGEVPNAERTYIASDVNINADALTKGDGGRVIVWADEVTGFYGNISAKGGNVFGNGGLVEVSGKEQLIFRGNVDTSAPNGFPGILLLDPTNITIADGTGDEGGDGTDTFAGNNSGEAGSILSTPLSEINDTAPTTIYESELEGLSGDTNVFLQATNDITVDDLSDNELNFAAGTGAIAFTADADRNGVGNFMMEDTADTIKTNGRSIGISGASLTLGNIDTFGVAADGAGQLLDTAQIVGTESGVPLESISGNLSSSTDVDLFQLYLTGDGTFSASTVGGSEVASQLFLFDASGSGVYANDVEADCSCFQSNLPAKHPLTPSTPGIYYLGISVNDNDPISSGGEIFPDGFFPDGFDVYAPTGPGGISSLINWNGDSFNFGGSYTISLTGAEAPDSTFAETATSNSGSITLNANNGSVSVGNLNASATGAGGSITLNATRDILLKSPVSASGDFGDDGSVSLQAGRNITLNGEVSFSTNSNIILEANNDININDLTDNQLTFGTNFGDSIAFTADADGNSLGSFSMNQDNTIEAGARDLKISGASITVGNIRTSTVSGNGGSISLNAKGDISTGREIASRSRDGSGGDISLTAGGDISTEVIGSESFLGSGGDISLMAGGDIIAVSLESFSRDLFIKSGAISLTAKGDISTGSINSTASSNGGSISLNAGGNITNTNFILSKAFFDNSGDISLNAGADIKTGTIMSDSNVGNGGAISLTATTGDIKTGSIDSTAEFGNSGAISVTAQKGRIDVEDISSLSSAGNAGDITLITKEAFSLKDGTISSASGSGNAGNISLTTEETVSLTNSSINSSTREGRAGKLTVTASESVELGGGGLFSETVGSGIAGDLTIDTSRLTVRDGAKVSTATLGKGSAGKLTINSSDVVEVIGELADGSSGSVLGTLTFAAGDAGDLTINTDRLIISDGAVVTSGAFPDSDGEHGQGGDINLTATESVELSGGAINTLTTGSGDAGDLTIDSKRLIVQDISFIEAITSSRGNGGNIQIKADDSISVGGDSVIDSFTDGSGRAGNISITSDFVDLFGTKSRFSTSSRTASSGESGNITVTAGSLRIADDAAMEAQTRSINKGGEITVNAKTLQVTSGGQLSTTTFGIGQAGDLTLSVLDSITLEDQGSGLLANTTEGSTGEGGSIFIDPRTVIIRDGARVAVNSEGEGKGGDIDIFSESLTLDNGIISANTASSEKIGGDINIFSGSLTLDNESTISAITESTDGGNIKLEIDDDPLLLRRESEISATAGDEQFGGNGGNIIINAPFIIAFPKENSDVTANAFRGNGGEITIDTNVIFGIEERDRLTPLSDLTASSELGVDGEIDVETLGIDPTRGLLILPEETVNTQISQGCQTVRGKEAVEYFEIGRGGLSPTPYQPLNADEVWQDWIPLESESENGSDSGTTINFPHPANTELISPCPAQ